MILNLLKLEYKKFKSNSVIQLLIAMFIILMPAAILFGDQIGETPNPFISREAFFNFPTVWEYMGYAANWLSSIFLGFIAIYIVTSEITNKTMRQSIIIGMTRKEYFIGKLSFITLLSLFATLYYILITVIIGVVSAENLDTSKIFDNEWAGLRMFLMSMSYSTFGLMLGLLMRKSGFATFFYLSYVMFLESMIKLGHYQVIPNNSMNYYPMNVTEDLHVNPFFKFLDNVPQKFQDNDIAYVLTHNQAMIATSIYIVIFIGLSYLILTKKDV